MIAAAARISRGRLFLRDEDNVRRSKVPSVHVRTLVNHHQVAWRGLRFCEVQAAAKEINYLRPLPLEYVARNSKRNMIKRNVIQFWLAHFLLDAPCLTHCLDSLFAGLGAGRSPTDVTLATLIIRYTS